MNKSDSGIWKNYPEFDFIQGSSIGRVRTLDRVVSNGKGMYVKKGRVLKQWYNNSGYLYVHSKVNGKKVNRSVHRLVAQTFIPNPDNLPEVNHINGDRTDNRLVNLEWCTHEYNMAYKEKYGVSAKEAAPKSPVYAVNLITAEVSRFRSQREAGRELGVNDGGINNVIKGRRNHTGGYWFTKADNNAAESTRNKFGDEVANKVAELINEN